MVLQKLLELLGSLQHDPQDGQPESDLPPPSLHRLDPLLMLSLLDALERYDSALANQLSEQHSLSRETLVGLAASATLLGPGQLEDLLDALDHHPRYDDIATLAGRNCYSLQSARLGGLRKAPLPLLARKLSSRLQPLLGEAMLELDVHRRVVLLRITDSIFAHGRYSFRTKCGFYVGYLEQLGHEAGIRSLEARELSCACQSEDERCCILQLAV